MHTLKTEVVRIHRCPFLVGLYFTLVLIILPFAGIQGARQYNVRYLHVYMVFLILELVKSVVVMITRKFFLIPLLNIFVSGYILHLSNQFR
jgi:hypothetical protein